MATTYDLGYRLGRMEGASGAPFEPETLTYKGCAYTAGYSAGYSDGFDELQEQLSRTGVAA